MFKPEDLFDLSQTEHAGLFAGCDRAWEVLRKIEGYLAANLKPGLHNSCEGVAFGVDRALTRFRGRPFRLSCG